MALVTRSATSFANQSQLPLRYRAAAHSVGMWLTFLLLSIIVLALIPRTVQGF